MRQGARLLIGPLVGVALLVALTGCGSSGTDGDPVVSPPTTEAAVSGEAASTTAVAATPAPPTAAPTPQATPASGSAAMTAQELAALEAELTQIDAILAELSQNFAAD